MTIVLTTEQLEKFDKDGCLVIPDFFTTEKAQELKTRAKQLLEEFSLEGHPLTQFSTGTSQKHVGDEYFLESGDKIRFFFEEAAFNEQGELKVPKERAINKIGHGLHELDTAFSEFSLDEKVKVMTRQLGFQSPLLLQSMLIFKQPYIGGLVPDHQDSSFLYTDPLSAVGFWFALEDCTATNGCLWFIPGSHKKTPITRRFIRDPHGSGTVFTGDESLKFNESDYVMIPVSAGSLVLIHGSVIHKSAPNYSKDSRYIYTFHVIEGNSHYPTDNWLQPPKNGSFTCL